MTRMTTTILMITTTTAKTIVLIKKETCPEDGLPFMVKWVDSKLPLLLVDDGVAMQIKINIMCTQQESLLLLSQVMSSLQLPSELHVSE